MKHILYAALILVSCVTFTQETIQTIYGECTVSDSLICDLINSKAFNRLKGINQYGIAHYIHPSKHTYTRHTHSLGVFMLLHHYGASKLEQIAGLLHDVSHTVFSHVGDHLIRTSNMTINQSDNAYQDEKHLMILSQTDVAEILAKHNIPLESINHKSGTFHMLEEELPDICADRLEYNLYGGFAEGWLTVEDIHEILSALHYQDGRWFFDDAYQAKQLSTTSIRLCTEIFTTPYNMGSYNTTAQAMLKAVDIGLISFNDILFAQDDAMLATLTQSNDPEITSLMQQALQSQELYVQSDSSSYDFSYIGKFRGLNPWIAIDDTYVRLTDIDQEFKAYYDNAKRDVRTKKYYRYR